jgi:ribosome recycling factor
MPLNQVATVSVPEPRMLTVQVWDRSNVQPVEKAIRSAGLGLNPITDGQLIRLPIPDLTEERRKELAKLVGQYAEKAKVAVRNVRRDGMDQLKQDEKKHEISEDEHKRLETDVQKMTDDTIKEIDVLAEAKEKEILGQ